MLELSSLSFNISSSFKWIMVSSCLILPKSSSYLVLNSVSDLRSVSCCWAAI
jgi:hypothetical protein